MKLKIQDFGVNQQIEEVTLKVDSLDEVNLLEPAEIKFTLSQREEVGIGTVYSIIGSYAVTVKVQCVRCLKEIAQNISGKFNWNFLEPKEYLAYIKSLKVESELDSEGFEEALDGEIDILDLVRQQIILDLDSYPTCKPDCEDDSEIKKYTEDEIDSRWAKLLEIKE